MPREQDLIQSNEVNKENNQEGRCGKKRLKKRGKAPVLNTESKNGLVSCMKSCILWACLNNSVKFQVIAQEL